jgi:hypothetical protein
MFLKIIISNPHYSIPIISIAFIFVIASDEQTLLSDSDSKKFSPSRLELRLAKFLTLRLAFGIKLE